MTNDGELRGQAIIDTAETTADGLRPWSFIVLRLAKA
jgi:hypothetical protein